MKRAVILWIGLMCVCLPAFGTTYYVVGEPGPFTTEASLDVFNTVPVLSAGSPSAGQGATGTVATAPPATPPPVTPPPAAPQPPAAPPPAGTGAGANTPIAEMSNAVPICSEPCIIAAITATNAVLQFGIGSTWGSTFTTNSFPLSVDYSSPNLALSPFDPAPGVVKELAAQMQSTGYSVIWSQGGISQETYVPALTSASPGAH